MPDPITGTVAAITGATSLFGSISSNKAASKATDASSAANAAALDFQKQQYQDWQDTFGPIQDNLSKYYQNISPDYFEATGLTNFMTERAAQIKQLDTTLAQRGLSNSGLAATMKRETAINTAEQRATIRTNASTQAAAAQSNFLQIGVSTNPSAALGNTLNQQASQAAQSAATAQQTSQQSTASTVGMLGKFGINYAQTGNPLGVLRG